MKRVIALVLLLSGVMALFAFNVSAVSWKGSAYDTDQVGDVIMDTHVYALDYEDYDNTNHPYKFYLYVTVRLQNIDSDEPAYISIPRFTISPGDGTNSAYLSIESYSPDLTLSVDGGIITISPSDSFSYSNGIVIPPNSSLYAVGSVEISTSTFTWTPSVVNSTFTSSTSNVYDYGTAVDFSSLITELDAYFSQEHLDNNNILTLLGYLKTDTGNINTAISNLAGLISYIGSYGSIFPNINHLYETVENLNTASNNLRIFATRYRSHPIIDAIENYYNSYDDTQHYQVAYHIDFYYSIYLWNLKTNAQITNTRQFAIRIPYLGSSAIAQSNIDLINSNFVDGYRVLLSGLNRNVYFYPLYSDDRYMIIPQGSNTLDFKVTYYFTYKNGDSVPNIDAFASSDFVNWSDITISDTGYQITSPEQSVSDIKNKFLEFFDLWKGNSTTNQDISDDSSNLSTTSDQIHTQEAAYYNQNALAIESTGLSNYRFNTEQSNGISAVSIDFTSLWNALGSWNSVYIFTLTLTIALTILRHAPNAISTARRRNYDHNERGS